MNQNNELKHFGVPGMKWGQRKQRETSGSGRISRKKERKQNYKLVKQRIKENRIKDMDLQDYEKGGISSKNVKKYLGKDITVDQVSDYIRHRNNKANKAVAAYGAVALASVIGYYTLGGGRRR